MMPARILAVDASPESVANGATTESCAQIPGRLRATLPDCASASASSARTRWSCTLRLAGAALEARQGLDREVCFAAGELRLPELEQQLVLGRLRSVDVKCAAWVEAPWRSAAASRGA